MPTTLKCDNCGYVFKEWQTTPAEAEWGRPKTTWYPQLYMDFNGRCPRCKKKMPSPLAFAQQMKIEVKPAPKPVERVRKTEPQRNCFFPLSQKRNNFPISPLPNSHER